MTKQERAELKRAYQADSVRDASVIRRILDDLDAAEDRCAVLEAALVEATQSLEFISEQGGRGEYMEGMMDVKQYAFGRSSAARATLDGVTLAEYYAALKGAKEKV